MLSAAEERVCAEIAAREDELVELVQALVRFDTTTHTAGAPSRQEAYLQHYLAERLRAAGAEVAVSEPEASLVAGHPYVPDGFTFAGRPQLLARFPGSGDGGTLLLNGHVDVVDVEPRDAWEHDPFAAVVADGLVHGRGSCDMKGGVASMVFAAETLARLDVPLAGDLLVNTVTEEESSGAGGLVTARTVEADAAIVTEPTKLDLLVACRGSLLPTLVVEGRAGHAGFPPRHPHEGGAVNAIEKAAFLLDAIRRLRDEWSLRPRHPYLSPADCVPTMIAGGEWIVSYPASCRVECHVEYLPDRSEQSVMDEFVDWIMRAAAADPWLAEHPPRIEWNVGGVPPAEIGEEEPVVQTTLAAARDLGLPSRIGGFDNWHDGATLIVEGGIPALIFGPGDVRLAHTASEHVPIADLVACAQAVAVTAMRFCG